LGGAARPQKARKRSAFTGAFNRIQVKDKK
jgi:hypothetical protein